MKTERAPRLELTKERARLRSREESPAFEPPCQEPPQRGNLIA
jgi:hypothetical protein